jgi:CHAT domain-containing protein
MRKAAGIQIIILLLSASILHAQCPARDSILKHINSIYSSLNAKHAEKLEQLLRYKDHFKKCFSTNDSTYISLLRKIGFTCSDMADYLGAVNYFKQALDINTNPANSSSVRTKDLISGYYFLSTFYDSLSNVAEKIKAADKCIEYSMKPGMPPSMSGLRSLYTKIEYYFDIGDYYECARTAGICEKYATGIIRFFSDSLSYNTAKSIAQSTIAWHVNALLSIGKFEEAENLLANKVEEYKKEKLKNYLALTYAQLAELCKGKKDTLQALSYYKLAFATYRDNGDDFNCKQILNNIGQTIYLKNSNRALENYRRALQYQNRGEFSARSNSIETFRTFGNMANVYVQMALYDSAFKYFQFAFDQLKAGINETVILNSSPEEFLKYKKTPYLSALVIDKGDAFFEKYKFTKDVSVAREAVNIYKVADRLLKKIRSGQSELQSKLFWRKDTRRLYEHAVEACYLQKNITDAFYFFERSRAVLLSDQLAEQHWLASDDISKRVQLNKKIMNLQAEADITGNNSKRTTDIQGELILQKQEQQRLEEQIRIKSPLYYQGIDPDEITLDDVKRKLLKDHQALLEIFSGDSAVYFLLITSGNNYFHRINKNEFDKVAGSYISYISDPGLLNRDFAGFRKTSHHLYQMIFQNAIVPAGRIIISLEGRYFPFESLIPSNNTDDPVYFLKDHAVSYTYSARYLLNDFSSGKTQGTGNFLGIAPVQYTYKPSLPSLTGSEGSLKTIGSFINHTQNQVTANASRNNFLQTFPGFKIIQLYTHASDSSDKKEPVIYFADSALYLSELIPGNQPVTRLIVLSACETGNGQLYKGEGVFSFNRGFAALGIPSCIANLWSVDNITTYRITEYFYKYLFKGDPVDVALQKAKLEFLNSASGENKLPYYWAPAVLIGKTDSIILKKTFYREYFFLLALLAGAALFGLFQYIRKKRHRSCHTGK